MTGWLAIVAYQCRIGDAPDGSLDVQVRYFDLKASSDVETALRTEDIYTYANDAGDTVSWPLVEILAIQPLADMANGDELIGFIAGAREFAELAEEEARANFCARGPKRR